MRDCLHGLGIYRSHDEKGNATLADFIGGAYEDAGGGGNGGAHEDAGGGGNGGAHEDAGGGGNGGAHEDDAGGGGNDADTEDPPNGEGTARLKTRKVSRLTTKIKKHSATPWALLKSYDDTMFNTLKRQYNLQGFQITDDDDSVGFTGLLLAPSSHPSTADWANFETYLTSNGDWRADGFWYFQPTR